MGTNCLLEPEIQRHVVHLDCRILRVPPCQPHNQKDTLLMQGFCLPIGLIGMNVEEI